MIISTILSLVGGSGVRMLWGEVSDYFKKKQDHAQELERMRLQSELDDKAHARQIETIKLEADKGLKVVQAKALADYGNLELDIWGKGVLEGGKATGIKLVDAWNASIRPAAASLSLFLWGHSVYVASWIMTEQDWQLVCGIIGYFFADRSMAKRGK